MMISNSRTSDDWNNASERIYYVSNDSYIIGNLVDEIRYLGELDILIQEYCASWETGKAPINTGPRITMLSRLFVLHAYEVIRCLDEFDYRRSPNSGGNLANFKTGRFKDIKKKLELIRIPMVKLQAKGTNKSSFITLSGSGRNIIFISNEGDILVLKDLIEEIFNTINSYIR